MNKSLPSFRKETEEVLVDLLWRQWCSLGVAGHAESANPNYLIDPETLVLATSSIGVSDPRLFDEALDWLGTFGSLINLQRLKNIQKATSLGDEQVLSAMADWLTSHASQPRWKTFVSRAPKESSPRTLFAESGDLSPRTADGTFLNHGLIRAQFEARRMSRAPDPLQPANLLLVLRALIGVSARAEVILYLAGGAPTHAAELARATHYSPRTMQALLQEMALSGHLFTQDQSFSDAGKIRKGANRRYFVKAQNWSFLTNNDSFPGWYPWPSLLALGRRILTVIPSSSTQTGHPAVLASKLRDAVSLYQQSHLYLRTGESLSPQGSASSEEFLSSLMEHFPSAVRSL